MNDLYLNNEIKEFYKNDFENSLSSKDDFWKIETPLVNFLTKINSNDGVQTLYSKYWKGDAFRNSYLVFCYKIDLENKLFKEIVPRILSKFNELNKCSCIYKFNYPRNNENYNPKRKLGFSCTDNKDHFRINHIKLDIKSRDISKHNEFWNSISKELMNL
ncbi:hypothetical protein [Seonamhaeicola sp.]|uniref:hypothetical protein n=1 Tax=Seonamhaeicola sp. TaxID=1912245 RepID=UPI0035623D81